MDRTLKEELHNFLLFHDLIDQNREALFVVAYSGGRDSTALLHSLVQLKRESLPELKLVAAYYWHPWRPLQEDLQIVYRNCKALNVQWIILTPDLTLPKSEVAARQDRYKQLANLAYDLDATAILTAHHQDDNVETILFRIFRGTGLDGMVGIPEIRMLPLEIETREQNQKGETPETSEAAHAICLARPLLRLPRYMINDYVQSNQLQFVEDPTNIETRIKRNFIRHELLPKIETAFPNVRQSLIRLSQLTEGELEIIDTKVSEVWRELFDPKTGSLDEVRFNQLLPSFQRRIIRQFLEEAGEEFGYSKVEEVIDFITGKKRKPERPALLSLGKDRFISIYRNKITLEKPQKFYISPLKITVPGQVSHLDLKATFSITPLTSEQRLKSVDFSKLGNDEIYVDLSGFEGRELILRGREKGDRIKPLGMSESIKLKRFLINRSIPRFKRDSIPLLATNADVLWVVGIGISDDIRVKNLPTHKITIQKEE